MRTSRGSLLFALFIAAYGFMAHADDDPEAKVRKSLVFIKVSGDSKSTGETKQTQGTGFIVSEEGLVLTTYHLISDLGDVVPKSVTIKAIVGGKSGAEQDALIADFSQQTDLLLLKIPQDPSGYPKLDLGDAGDHNKQDRIHISGFPNQIPYRHQTGIIQGQDGGNGYLWTIGGGLTLESGESGSPVYDDRAVVIGVAKGTLSSLNFMIPIEYGGSLLAQMRMKAIQASLNDFEALRSRIEWKGVVQGDEGGDKEVTITFDKMIGGKPQIVSIQLFVTAYAIDKNGAPFTLSSLRWPEDEHQSLTVPAQKGKTGGAFLAPGLWQEVVEAKRRAGAKKITALKVVIKATLDDGSTLLPDPIMVENTASGGS